MGTMLPFNSQAAGGGTAGNGTPQAPYVIGSSNITTSIDNGAMVTVGNVKAGDLTLIMSYVEPANEGATDGSASFGTFTLSGGFTLLSGFPLETDAANLANGWDDHRIYVWYHVATADTTNLQVSVTNPVGLDAMTTNSVTIRGVNTTNGPLSDSMSTAILSGGATTNTNTTPPVSLNLSHANSLVMWLLGDWSGRVIYPDGYSFFGFSTPGYPWASQPVVATKVYPAAGATGNVTASSTDNLGNDHGLTVALLSFRP